MQDFGSLLDAGAQVHDFIRAATTRHGGARGGREVESRFHEIAFSLFRLQFEYNPVFRQFCEARNATPAVVLELDRIPALPISAFKEFEVSCLPARQRTRVFHSSGTTGQRPSRHFHSPESLAIYEASLLPWFQAHVRIADGCRLVTITPPAEQAPHSSLAHMFSTVRAALGTRDSAFTGKVQEDGSWILDATRTLAVLQEAVSARRPVLLLGTAFLFVCLLDHLAERGTRLQLSPDSCVMETGGYKGRSRELPRAELHELIHHHLGVPANSVICEYGMSELSSQAYGLNLGTAEAAFHFPPWACVQVVSPETGREVAIGQTGLIRVLDLANVYSVMAIQTEDLAVRRTDGFDLIGRAAGAEARGCSLMSV